MLVTPTTEFTTIMFRSYPFFVIMVTNEKLLSSLLVGVEEKGGQTVLVHNINARSKTVVFNQIQDHLQQDKENHKPNSQ